MTLHDLYKSVSQLGFEDTLGEDGTSRFIYATNRALSEINALRPRRRSVTINHRVPTNLLFSQKDYLHWHVLFLDNLNKIHLVNCLVFQKIYY